MFGMYYHRRLGARHKRHIILSPSINRGCTSISSTRGARAAKDRHHEAVASPLRAREPLRAGLQAGAPSLSSTRFLSPGATLAARRAAGRAGLRRCNSSLRFESRRKLRASAALTAISGRTGGRFCAHVDVSRGEKRRRAVVSVSSAGRQTREIKHHTQRFSRSHTRCTTATRARKRHLLRPHHTPTYHTFSHHLLSTVAPADAAILSYKPLGRTAPRRLPLPACHANKLHYCRALYRLLAWDLRTGMGGARRRVT